MPATDLAPLQRRASALARQHGHVVTRRQLHDAAIPRWYTRNEIRQRRWCAVGRLCVVLHNGPRDAATRWRIAVVAIGRPAALDGVTALQAAGLVGLDDAGIHVSVPKGATPARRTGVRVHESRRFVESDVLSDSGLRRMRPAAAAVHAALWAVTDKQATLFVTMTVQQRLATVPELVEVLDRVRRHRRRGLLRGLLRELAGGAGSLGELDVAQALRRRGLPEPVRQSLRQRPSGTEYLDAEFPAYRLVLEVDGAGHDTPAQRLKDLLRDLRLLAEGSPVMRVPLVAWRLDEEAVLDVLEEVFLARGWRRPAA